MPPSPRPEKRKRAEEKSAGTVAGGSGKLGAKEQEPTGATSPASVREMGNNWQANTARASGEGERVLKSKPDADHQERSVGQGDGGRYEGEATRPKRAEGKGAQQLEAQKTP